MLIISPIQRYFRKGYLKHANNDTIGAEERSESEIVLLSSL